MLNLCMKGSFYISVNFKNPKPQIVTDKFTSVLNEKHNIEKETLFHHCHFSHKYPCDSSNGFFGNLYDMSIQH